MLTAAKADSAMGVGGDIAGGCPRFQVWPRDHHVTIYEPGRVGDGLGRHAQGRDHQDRPRMPGRAWPRHREIRLLGPRSARARAARAAPSSLPVAIFVTDAKREKIAADKATVDVAVSLDKPIGYFSTVKTITFPIPEGARPGEFEVFVGFDRNTPNAG